MQNFDDIDELETYIMYQSHKYYSEGVSDISDEQFDSLVDKLRRLNPNSKVLKTGWGFEVSGDKVKHKYGHIGSLDKAKTYEEIPDRFKQRTIYISPKLDGLSAVAYYENGQLVKGITRGDGNYGKDITDKMARIIGTQIEDAKFTGAVRGELIISNKSWEELNKKYTNLIAPRNFAAGIINRKDIDEDIKYIDLVVYKVVGQEHKASFSNREDMLQWLRLNFKNSIPIYYYPVLNLSSWDMYHEKTFEDFKTIGYGLDGLVLTNPEIIYDNVTKEYRYNEIAFKFKAESTTTFIKEIKWELSRTQRLIPIAVVEPVELSGAVVEKATCNNAQWVKEMGLGKNAKVEICRSNEVIPLILNVIQASDESLPIKCPICGSILCWDGVDLKCANENCPNLELSDLQQWCENVGETDGLQWTLMKQYLDAYKIYNLEQLYEYKEFVLNDLNTKKLSITELKIKEFFEKIYFNNIDVKRVLVGLNIPRLGVKTAELLSSKKVIIRNLILCSLGMLESNELVWTKQSLLEIVKDATTETILKNVKKFSILRYLYDVQHSTGRLIFEEENLSNNIRYVAVTGALQKMKRKDFESYIKQFGYVLSSNIKQCKYLITNTPESGSSKNVEARKYQIPIISENDFLKILQ